MNGEYGIVANVLETDRVFRSGAKAWLCNGTGGEGWHRFFWHALARSGSALEKWAPTERFSTFRAAWVPEHMRDRVTYFRGDHAEMHELAIKLNAFAKELRTRKAVRRFMKE